MIKPGTMCVLIKAIYDPSLLGKIFTITGPMRETCVPYLAGYETDMRRGSLPILVPPGWFKPLDDPDQFAKDPAYTQRTVTA